MEISAPCAVCKLPAGLYLVATPIGHLGDMTLRALTTLANADVIACEDTRTSGVLLHAFGIKTPTMSYHDHNADARRPEILNRLAQGQAVALISDAGMPAIADPGFKLVRACRDEGYAVTVVPGANAAVTALASSGLPTDSFTFAGFLSPKTVARRKALVSYKQNTSTLVFYEAPQRLAACLADMADVLGTGRAAAIARELTKIHEEIRRGTLGELAAYYAEHEARGEIVILVAKSEEDLSKAFDLDALLAERLEVTTVRDAVAEIAEITGAPKKEVYARALALGKKRSEEIHGRSK